MITMFIASVLPQTCVLLVYFGTQVTWKICRFRMHILVMLFHHSLAAETFPTHFASKWRPEHTHGYMLRQLCCGCVSCIFTMVASEGFDIHVVCQMGIILCFVYELLPTHCALKFKYFLMVLLNMSF